MSDQPTAATAAVPPDRVVGGRYRLEDLRGRGGSAEVWAAEDTSLGRRVAVKVVTTGGGDDAGRVGDEARLLARLSHPGLVPVYDAGTDDAGRPWVVMELVDGETLADLVGRGPVGSQRVAEVGRVLADALHYVHGQGLVHRDVKPANVLLARDGRVRLTDFGIARLVDAAKVTATGLTVGTASYLSPEQVVGGRVGAPTDVYALGLVLLECLTGAREYPGSAVEVALARLNRQPEVPDTLPAGWPGLLRAMTAREADERPTMQHVSSELGRVAAGGEATTVLAMPVLPRDQTQVMDRSQLAAMPAPAPRPAPRPASRQVPPRRSAAPPPPPSSNGARWVAALIAVVVLIGLAVFALQQTGGSEGRTPDLPSPDLPAELRDPLTQLRDLVEQ